nr:claudin domain-containing protein 2 [Vulpes vulpes]
MKSSRPGGRRSWKEVWGGPEEGVRRQQCPGCSQIWRDMWEGISRNCRTWERGLGAGGVLANLPCVALGSSLLGMGVKRSLQRGGILLGFLAKILMILSTATNYWIRYPGGHRGLWQECNAGTCSNIPCQTMLAVTGAYMVLAAGSGIVGLVMGLRIQCHEGDARGQTTSSIFFLCGLLLLMALTGYTVENAWKNDVFFSWSYFSGWLALPFSILAGIYFLLADMVVQSTDAISGFPVYL